MVYNTIYISVYIYDSMLTEFTTICIYNKSYEGNVFFQLNTTVPLTQDNFPCQTFMLRFDYICNLAEEGATNVQHGVGSICWIA